jgi:hypothetical protein
MAYVGNSPEKGNFRKADQITCSATATYNLLVGGVAVNPNQNQVICSLNGVVQSSGDSYTIANSQITFASALTSSDVIDFILILGDTLDVGVPSDDTVSTAKIQANAVTTAKITDGNVTAAKIASGVVPSLRPNANPLIINGDMVVAQRGTSTASITGGGFYTVDRFGTNNSGAFIGTWTQTQESLSSGDAFTDGFAKSLKMDNTTANGSPTANSQCRIDYNFEGQDLQLLKHGTASAEKTTLSFWIKATKTGTNIVKMYKPDADRSCSIAYTVSTTNTWEKKVLNFPADTTGTVIANDNTTGIQMSFGIAMGSSYTSGTLATTWAADSSANAFVGQVNNADSTSNNWEITGVQLEVGEYTSSTLPPFQHESYGDNLKRCMRYYFTDALYSSGGNTGLVEAYIGTSDANYKHIFKQFPVAMRAAPTISNIDFRQDVAASSTALTSIDSAFATTLTADLYGRNNDHAAPGYYHGADYSAEL